MSRYHIVGRAGAGSLIVEFLLREVGVAYDISFPDPAAVKQADFHAANPLGRIPVLICPDGHRVFETMAIIAHITSKFDRLAPPAGTALYDRFNQFMALLATSVYPAYHRQHHCYYYGDKAPSISVPVTCVVGDQDGATPPELVESTAKLIPGATFEVIKDAGHIPCAEQPAAVIAIIRAMISKI